MTFYHLRLATVVTLLNQKHSIKKNTNYFQFDNKKHKLNQIQLYNTQSVAQSELYIIDVKTDIQLSPIDSHYARFSQNLVTHLSDVESQSDQYQFSQLQQQLQKPHITKQLGEPVRDLKQKHKSKTIQWPAHDSHTFNAKTHHAIYSSSLPTNNAKPSQSYILKYRFHFCTFWNGSTLRRHRTKLVLQNQSDSVSLLKYYAMLSQSQLSSIVNSEN
ncbi:Hypothetical_protein [Hexamita inflata]|uniref:Hypothetical_protein n=1 Tax=Hexamita inflata TaxID=28002 RepID=A0AA86QAJ0_9EUKA|nr:Hypothetical protein HINF_LOCUS36205 [Hexamita inflata]